MTIHNLYKICKKSVNWELIIITVFLLLYAVAAISVSINRYWQYDAFWLDFGIFDETIWKFSHFQLPVIPSLFPPFGKIIWSDHLNPSAMLLSPLYWLTDKQEIILIAQVVFVMLSALVAYRIALKVIHNPLVRIALVVSYLGFVGMQNALYTDVHNIVFATLPLMLTIWAIFNKKWRLYWIFLLLTMGFQESLAAVAIGLGFFLLLRKDRQIKIALITILIGVAYGLLAIKVIIPFLNQKPYNFSPEYPAVWYEWITRFFSWNLKTPTILLTFLTFGLLPFGSIATYPLIIDHFLERFVLNSAATRWDLGFHYNALLSPIMFLGAIDVLEKFQSKKQLKKFLSFWAIGTMVIVFFLHRFYLHGPLMLATHPVFYQQTQRNQFITKFVDKIPTNGFLMIQNNLGAHFTHYNIVMLNTDIDKINPDIIALDIRPGQNANNFYPLPQSQVADFVASLSANPNYQKDLITDSQLIFIKKK